MIDVAVALSVSDGRRRFELDVRFASQAPVVALYGPSGAGKSLTLQAMAGLLRPAAGHVRVGGKTWFDAAAGVDVPAQARGVGYLFQHYALFPHLSVRENVAFGLTTWRRRLSAADAARVDELLESFGLAALAHSRPCTLSGGQQQRVALARALACKPQVLLLDEPFAALNPMLRQQLREELAAVRARWGIPAVMITHDVEDVLALANVAYLVEGGRAVRAVDLDQAESRELAASALQPAPSRPPRPQQARLRTLLSTRDAA
ncbi:ABC transporter ATP-binding protein [Azohydromonas lata]|uniref:ATP-binding cassette domain-containing protein n=1 Tax=Azohydromonas lata TaxID=45677 RepID=A0ABU5IN38_9BURK|nr:ATP-binding cassette domain-containing protein [Azohydromonas lata]MDZ5460309.1 ATP-binding cassette domain-containing protein [Azohydromonas lata]